MGPWDKRVTDAMGSRIVLLAAVAVVAVWAATGPLFGFSDTWQLVINTGTTVVTFLMIFVLQRTQNRDTAAIQLKLDELVHGVPEADDSVAGIETET